MERDGFYRSLTSKLNYFLPGDTKSQEKKSCVIPDWHTCRAGFKGRVARGNFHSRAPTT